jgi:hypothetical protein
VVTEAGPCNRQSIGAGGIGSCAGGWTGCGTGDGGASGGGGVGAGVGSGPGVPGVVGVGTGAGISGDGVFIATGRDSKDRARSRMQT